MHHEQEQQQNRFQPPTQPGPTVEQVVASSYPDRSNPGVDDIDRMRLLPSDPRDGLRSTPEPEEDTSLSSQETDAPEQ